MIASVSAAASSVDRRGRRGSLDGMNTNMTSRSSSSSASFSATPGPSGFDRSANIRRRASLLRKRLPNKSSPHVGWFRHSPPSTSASTRKNTSSVATVSKSSSLLPRPNSIAEAKELLRSSHNNAGNGTSTSSLLYGPSSLHMEASPFVGWFRHAPPSDLSTLKKRSCSETSLRGLLDATSTNTTSRKHIKITTLSSLTLDKENDCEMSSAEVEAFLKKIGSSFFVDGRLPGGQPLYGNENDVNGTCFPPLTFLDQRVSSSLQHPRTNTTPLTSTANTVSSSTRSMSDDTASCSTNTTAFAGNADTPSATFSILDRLAHWLLLPLTTDAIAGVAFTTYDDAMKSRVGSGIINAILPFFASILKNILLLENGNNGSADRPTTNRHMNQNNQQEQEEEDSMSSSVSDDDGSCFSSEDDFDASGFNSPLASSPLDQADGGLSQLLALDVSVSSLAERYYAHEAFKELIGSSSISSSSAAAGSTGIGARGGIDSISSGSASIGAAAPAPAAAPSSQQESLDYVITQIDIARMLRNASRHLDVESILSLPTITYVSRKSEADFSLSSQEGDATNTKGKQGVVALNKSQEHKKQGSTSQETQDEDLNWSWMMVPGDMDDIGESKPSGDTTKKVENDAVQEARKEEGKDGQLISDVDEDTCVICLEHFVDGDRLRVLPCEHLFHVGCIDKWLSGSSSDEECFTAGCPTCKKHPCHEEEEVAGGSNDGSVPSWAFAKLGDVLASAGSTLTR